MNKIKETGNVKIKYIIYVYMINKEEYNLSNKL